MPCAQHPEVEAFHQCTRCDAWHCEPCLKVLRTTGSAPLLLCPSCGGVARVASMVVPGAREDLLDLARRPFTGDGPVTILALAVPYGLTVVPMWLLPFLFTLVYLGCLAAYYFQTVDHVGRGRAGLPFSADAMSRSEVVHAIGRGLCCLLVGVGPAALWRALIPGGPLIPVALLALGAAIVPAAIIAVSATGSGFAALWPLSWARIIARAPAAYGRLVGAFVASTAAWALGVFIASITVGRVPLVGPYLVGAANAALALLQAVLVGGFLRRSAAELGYE